jgi:hypothetical protein
MVDTAHVRNAAVTKRRLASVGAWRADPEHANRDEKNSNEELVLCHFEPPLSLHLLSFPLGMPLPIALSCPRASTSRR